MIQGIDHIGIATHSIEESRKIYETLGLEVEEIEVVEHEGVRVAMIPIGETRIELLEPIREDSPVASYLAKRGPGIHHICLKTGELIGDCDRLRDGGFKVLRDQPTQGAGDYLVNFIHPKSVGGVLVELMQPNEDAG